MPIRQKVVAFMIAISVFFVILELVRRRKLREEYSWLWLLTGAFLVTLTLWYDLLLRITNLIGAVSSSSTLFFFALVFLILVCVQFSMRISTLTNQVKDLVQEMTILKAKVDVQGKETEG